MKINAIKKLIKQAGQCRVMTGQQGQQWIGTRQWAVRVDDGLRIAADSIKGLFDFDDEAMEKIDIFEEPLETADIWPVMRRTQNRMDECRLGVNNFGGVELLSHDGKMYACRVDRIRAAVERGDYREYWLGWDKDDYPLIIIMDGMMFAGIARPEPKSATEFVRATMEQWGKMEAAGFANDAEDEDEEEGEQTRMEE